MGGMVMMLVLLPFYWHEAGAEVTTGPLLLSWPVVISLGLLMAGAVGSARLTLGAHTPADLYRGYVVGAVAVFIATSLLC
jgi:membrane-associated phospholipid phosphatase